MPLVNNTDINARLIDHNVKALLLDARATVNGVTASTGSTQATGVLIDARITRVTTVAVAGDAMTLPPAIPGTELIVINAAAANSMDVFPAVGDAVNALSANAALAVAVNKTVLFVCAVAGTWNTIVTA